MSLVFDESIDFEKKDPMASGELDEDMLALLRGEKQEEKETPEYMKYLDREHEGESDEEEEPGEVPAETPVEEEQKEESSFDSLYPGNEYVFKTSFSSRLHQTSDEVKTWYSDIKNALLSYKKIKSRQSWDCETFRIGRDAIAKINVRGKTLHLYMSLEPDEVDKKYHIKNVGAKKKFAAVPTDLKVRSERAARYAKELILKLSEEEKLVALPEASNEDFRVPYMTNEELVNSGIIKPVPKINFSFGKGFPMTTEVNDEPKTMDSLFDTESEYDSEEEQPQEDEQCQKRMPGSASNNVVVVPNDDDGGPVKVEYSRSYMARLIQSEDSLKELYNKVKQTLLSYKGVKMTVSWKYESFSKGRTQVAKINVKGKSLYVYLAPEAIEENEKKRSGIRISTQKQFAKVPVLLKVRDEKSLKKVLSRIDLMMTKLGIKENPTPCTDDFRLKNESTRSLIEKGLIKMRIVGGKVELTPEAVKKLNKDGRLEKLINAQNAKNDTQQEEKEEQETNIDDTQFGDFYRELMDFINNVAKEYSFFPTVLSVLRHGESSIALKKRIMLRAIDETWVRAIEDALPALDLVIRRPSKFIEEREDLVNIEMSRNISSRSIQHLSQHTNLISKIEGDTVTPSKILNVYREETMMTYENKFVNTLLMSLYIFVSKRYEIALKDGADEKQTSIEFHTRFNHGEVKGKVDFRIELDEPISESDDISKNYTYTSTIWERVQKINNICTAYMGSEFVKSMGNAYIRPPVIRTNAILKNRELHQCLELWEFISGFDEAGYEVIVKESLENVDEAYIQQLYCTIAAQYALFRHRINSDFDSDDSLDYHEVEKAFKPRIIEELDKIDPGEFDIKEKKVEKEPAPGKNDRAKVIEAISIALEADRIIRDSN